MVHEKIYRNNTSVSVGWSIPDKRWNIGDYDGEEEFDPGPQ
jgi:hypothetical protein